MQAQREHLRLSYFGREIKGAEGPTTEARTTVTGPLEGEKQRHGAAFS